MFRKSAVQAVVFALLAAAVVSAGDFEVTWHTIDGGGGHATGGVFELNGTIGQPDAGYMTGGTFERSACAK